MSNESNVTTCITECLECHRICMETLIYGLRKGGDYADADHAQLLLDCSQICLTAVDFMTRDSNVVHRISEITSYLCEKAAVSCERWASSDAKMKQCMDQCRRCGECCRKIMIAAA